MNVTGTSSLCEVVVQEQDRIICKLPANTYGRQNVTVTVDGQASNHAPYFYYEVGKVKLPYGPIHGTTTVIIYGRGFVDFGFIAIRFGNESRTMEVNGTFLSSEQILCVTPPSEAKAFAPLLSMNNQTWTPTTNDFVYYPHPVLSSLDPVLGPVLGGTTVLLYGVGFFNTSTFLARFDGVETACQLLKGTVNNLDVAECVTPPQVFQEAQFASVNISIDSPDTAKPHFTGEPVPFYYHRQTYATRGPYPPMLPDRGLVNATVLINPEEMRTLLTVPDWPSAGYASDFDVKVSVDLAVADFTQRQEHRVVQLNTSFWGSAEVLHDDIVVTVELDTAGPIAAKLMETDCSDIRVWDDNYVTALPFWMEPGTCNSTATTLWVAFTTLNVTGDSRMFYLSYGLHTSTPTMNGEAVFLFMDGMGRRWGTDGVRTSGAWSYSEYGTSSSHSQMAISEDHFKFRGDQEYTAMPRTLNPIGTNNSRGVKVRAKYSVPSEAVNSSRATYVMYVSESSSAVYLHTSSQPGVATLAWDATGTVRLYGANSDGYLFDGTANCGPLDGAQVFEWTVHPTQMYVTIGNCTALRPNFGDTCTKVGAFWERTTVDTTGCSQDYAGGFDNFYLYSGVHSSNSSASLQQSFDWLTVRNNFAEMPSTNVTSGENLWRLDFSIHRDRAAKELLEVGVSFNGQTSDGTLSQFCRNLSSWFQYAVPRTVAFSPPALLIGEASVLSVRSDEVLNALANSNYLPQGSGWLDFPLNEASFGAATGIVPYAVRRLASLWLKLGTDLVVECSMVASGNLTCPIPSYESSPASFQFGNVSAAFSYDGYHYAELAEKVVFYRFNSTITSGAFASQFGGGDVSMLVTILGGDVLNVSTISVKFDDTGNQIDVDVQDETERLSRVPFTFTVPYVGGAPLSPMPNITCNATNITLARTNTTCTNLTSSCVESTATCPPETSASCKYCTDQANYPCYKAPFGYNPVVSGRCYAPDGTWSSFVDGDTPLYVSILDDQFSRGPTLNLYDPASILTGLPSPLLIPSVKRAGDTKSTITVDGSPLATSMEPVLKLTSDSGSTVFSGEASLRVPEPWSDIGYKAASASPNLLSKTTRMQMLYTGPEIEASDLDSTDTISTVQFRYWGDEYAPNANLYNARLRYSWIDLNDGEAYECLRSSKAANTTDAETDCLREIPAANMTTAMSATTLLYDDNKVFVEDTSRDEYWLNLQLDRDLEAWDGEKALLLDLSYEVKARARTAKFFVHGTVVPGQTRTLVWFERRSGDDSRQPVTNTAPVQEMDFVPFVRFTTSTVYLEFEDLDMQSTDEDSTDSYSVDVSLNGGITYIGNTVQREAAYIEMTMKLGGLDYSLLGDEEQAGFKEVLNATAYNTTDGCTSTSRCSRYRRTIADLDVSITSISDASTSSRRRRQLEVSALGEDLQSLPPHRMLTSAATEITFRLYSSETGSVAVSHAASIEEALDTSNATLLEDLEVAMGVTLTSVGVVKEKTSSYDPSTSGFYTDPAFYVYPYSSVVLDSLNPASSAITTPMTITLSGSNFVNPDDYGIKNQYARWILDTSDGGLSEWYTTEVTYKSSTEIEIQTPSAIDSKYVTTETDTEGYINAYLTISFNGDTYTNLDYAVYFTFYQDPTIVRSFLYYGDSEELNGDPDYGASGTYSTDGLTRVFDADQSGKDGETQLYIYINGTGVFLRSSKLVCIFVQCGTECSDSQEDDLYNCRSTGTCKIENAAVYKTPGSNAFIQVSSKSQWCV